MFGSQRLSRAGKLLFSHSRHFATVTDGCFLEEICRQSHKIGKSDGKFQAVWISLCNWQIQKGTSEKEKKSTQAQLRVLLSVWKVRVALSPEHGRLWRRPVNFVLCFPLREAGECPSGAAPPLVQSSLALLQIQPDQLQDRPVALRDRLLRKLNPPRLPKSRDWVPSCECDKQLFFFVIFFFIIFITRQSWMYADLHCAHASVQNKCS